MGGNTLCIMRRRYELSEFLQHSLNIILAGSYNFLPIIPIFLTFLTIYHWPTQLYYIGCNFSSIAKAHQRRGIRVSGTFVESRSSGVAGPFLLPQAAALQKSTGLFAYRLRPWKGMSRSDRGWEIGDSLRPHVRHLCRRKKPSYYSWAFFECGLWVPTKEHQTRVQTFPIFPKGFQVLT